MAFDEFLMNSSSIERFWKTDDIESRNKSKHTINGLEEISHSSTEHDCVCIYIYIYMRGYLALSPPILKIKKSNVQIKGTKS